MEFESFVLAASTADLGEERRARRAADAIEFRMDLAEAPLDALAAYDGDLPVIATNRSVEEGGAAVDGADRLEALIAAADVSAVEAVDVELATVLDGDGRRVLERVAAAGAAAIVSAHDFEATPSRSALDRTLDEAASAGDVGKLAVTATGPGDVLTLLELTHDRTEAGQTVATMAMGEAGRHSRVVAPLYGSKIGYAPVDREAATAPGQYDLASFRSLLADLRPRE